MWQTLQRQLVEVGLIEELFQIRANVLRLFNASLLMQTPILLLVAGVSGLIPIATIYPPGAMTVELEVRPIEQQLNVSLIPPSGRLESWDPGRLPSVLPKSYADIVNPDCTYSDLPCSAVIYE